MLRKIVSQIYAEFKDAHRALTSSPPAAPASGRVMLLNLGNRVSIMAVA